jgi:acyl-CoA dehydrogenase
MSMPEEYGGSGADKLFSMVLMEGAGAHQQFLGRLGPALGDRRALPVQLRQRRAEEEIPAEMAAGDMIGAIAMSEPGAGSDLQSIKTSAIKKGDQYVVNGSKTSSPTAGIAISSSWWRRPTRPRAPRAPASSWSIPR